MKVTLLLYPVRLKLMDISESGLELRKKLHSKNSINTLTITCNSVTHFCFIQDNLIKMFIAAHCSTPTAPSNGAVIHLVPECTDGMCNVSTIASFACDFDYYLVGYAVAECVGHDEWDQTFPTCEGKQCANHVQKLRIKTQKDWGCFNG